MRRYSTQQNVNTKMLWRKVGSKLILNTPKINDKNQKIDLEILFGLTHHSTKQYPQILQKYFFDWSIDIFQSLIDHIEFSTETQWRLVTAVCRMSKIYKGHNGKITSAPCNQLTLCNCQEKGECLMGGKMPNYGCSLWLSCHFSRATLKDNWFNDSFICKTIT